MLVFYMDPGGTYKEDKISRGGGEEREGKITLDLIFSICIGGHKCHKFLLIHDARLHPLKPNRTPSQFVRGMLREPVRCNDLSITCQCHINPHS